MSNLIQFKSIRSRLTTWFLIVALIPLLVVTGIIYTQRVHSIKEEAFHKLTAIRDLKAQQVKAWLLERTGDIKAITEDYEVRLVETKGHRNNGAQHTIVIRKLLERYLVNYQEYHEIFILNPLTGIIEISTNQIHEGEDKSENIYFTEPLRTRNPFINDIYFSKTLAEPSMTFSTPIFCLEHDGEHVVGILVARIDLKHSLYALLLNRVGMGETGETLIVNRERLALNELRWHKQAPLQLTISTQSAVLASQGESGIVEVKDYRGVPVLAAYTHIDMPKWGFVAKQDVAEVYYPIKILLFQFLILVGFAISMVFGIAMYLSRIFAKPIIDMTGTAQKIKTGDFSARVQPGSDDELGYLAEAFNNMTSSIASQIEESNTLKLELQKEKDFLDAVLNNIEDGIVACNADGVLTLFNRATKKFHGLPVESLPAEQWAQYYDLFLADGKTPMETSDIPLFKALKGEKIQDIEMVIAPKEGGKPRVIRASGQPLYNLQGGKFGAVVSMHDITERNLAEEALKKTHEMLLHSEKLSAIGSLSASIAHEFNNPLQGVMTVIKGVQRRSTLDEEDAKLMEMAVNECDRMKDLIKSLQDFNRPSSGRVAPMNIHATIDSLLLLSKKEYKTKGITVETNYAEDMPQIKAVADQIKQVLLNLFNNAAYACEGGGAITINTEVVSKENITIKIKDTGKGINPEHMDQIFDPFFTTKPAIKGTGLGLSVSYGIIKKHGGRIDVESEPDKGTTFTIILPVEGLKKAK